LFPHHLIHFLLLKTRSIYNHTQDGPYSIELLFCRNLFSKLFKLSHIFGSRKIVLTERVYSKVIHLPLLSKIYKIYTKAVIM